MTLAWSEIGLAVFFGAVHIGRFHIEGRFGSGYNTNPCMSRFYITCWHSTASQVSFVSAFSSAVNNTGIHITTRRSFELPSAPLFCFGLRLCVAHGSLTKLEVLFARPHVGLTRLTTRDRTVARFV